MVQTAAQTIADTDLHIPMSYEAFLAYGDDTTHAEWADGEVIVFMSPTIVHQLLAGFFYRLLASFVDRHRLGLVLFAPAQMRARPDGPAREPDIFFVADAHRDRLDERGLFGPADFVLEIVSESSAARDRMTKFNEYERSRIPEYLILDPRPDWGRLDFYRLGPGGKYQAVLPDADRRYHSAAIPGFWFREDWFWQDPLPNPDELLPQLSAITSNE